MDLVVHMVECKPTSTVASARVARFIQDTLGVILVDTRQKAQNMLTANVAIKKLIIVNGPMAFCDFLEPLAELVKKAQLVVWVQQDYILMPPSAESNAESPFRKVFAERKLRPIFWTVCHEHIKTGEDKYINWNQLTYQPHDLKTVTDNSILYYGAFREKRLPSFTRYFVDNEFPLSISTTAQRSKKFKQLGCNAVYLPPFTNVVEQAGGFAAALYVSDDSSHTKTHPPANRFYEMLSAGVPQFFDHPCVAGLSKAGIEVSDDWIVKDSKELASKFAGMERRTMITKQRELWSRDYVGELRQRLLELYRAL